MSDLLKTLMIITGIIIVLFMLLVGFNVWAFTGAPAGMVSPKQKQKSPDTFVIEALQIDRTT
ncbi:hypothetical protein [Endozoicomonas sp. 8E]|uniref:hypothetical protein n=1 Tax=Endozoicomonas sp. 8E TaxID=3035692 RepID=UPI00293917BD|nr:hypothetical protein [Endozoicomonas sp. 8E]WOG26117.1 hypothetical protein P6910_16290 [Endozoicomonas sp. 8E]